MERQMCGVIADMRRKGCRIKDVRDKAKSCGCVQKAWENELKAQRDTIHQREIRRERKHTDTLLLSLQQRLEIRLADAVYASGMRGPRDGGSLKMAGKEGKTFLLRGGGPYEYRSNCWGYDEVAYLVSVEKTAEGKPTLNVLRIPGNCTTIEEAFRKSLPVEAYRRIQEGAKWVRQGEVVLVENRKDDIQTNLPRHHIWDETTRELVHANGDHQPVTVPFPVKVFLTKQVVAFGRD